MIRLAMIGATTFSLISLTLLACSGCNGGGNTPPAPAPSAGASAGASAPGAETIVHIEDDGHSFDVTHGSAVTFKLASNAGTGFMWMPTGVDPNVLAQQGDRTSEVSSDVPGAPKMDVYHYLANAPGSTVVEMDLKRPWGNAPPGRVIHVTVNVH